MIKKVVVFIFILCSVAYAGEFDFGYADADGSRVLNFRNKIPFMFNDFEVTPYQNYKDSNAGYMFNFNLEIKKDFNNSWDMFFDVDYLTDEILEIKDQVDSMVGVGYELFNNYEDRHKVSYALVHRSANILHSLRYKFTHEGKIFKNKAIIYWILPNNEIQCELGTELKIFESLAFTVNHSYKTYQGKNSYLSTAGFKIFY